MEKITMNVKELVRATAAEMGKTQKDVAATLEAIDTVVKKQLAQVTPDAMVEVKVLPSGVSLFSEYVEPHEARNPMTGETIKVAGKNRVKAKVYSGIKAAVNPEFNEGDQKRFPNAIKDKLKLMSPMKYKTEIFEALIKMLDSGLIGFPEEYTGKGFIELIYEVDSKGIKTPRRSYPSEEEEKKLTKKGINIITETHYLTLDEELALKQINAAKTELVNIYRFKQSSGKDRFDLATEKANKMHDDRAYCIALLGWQLAQLRRSNLVNKKRKVENKYEYFSIRAPKKVTRF